MINAIGITTVALIVAAITFYTALRLMDYWRCWSEAGLGAFIPQIAIAIPLALASASLAVCLII